ncbi:MAG: peptidoglycan DD-metalloendopeptidase family protein, partial [Verrucomicrobiota bacterium]
DGQGYYLTRAYRANEHLGDDWNGLGGGNTDLGDLVYAIGDGLVVHSHDERKGWGNVVIIRHAYREDGEVRFIESLYGHLQDRKVEVGDLVKRGDQIGTIGNNNGMYFAHLHFEIRHRLGVGLRRADFPRDDTTYFPPKQFIAERRPAAAAPPAAEIIIKVAKNGDISSNGVKLSKEELLKRLKLVANLNNDQAVVIRGESETKYGDIMSALEICKEAELWNVAFATAAAADASPEKTEDGSPGPS